MKIKYFLRGLGTGILFATIILTISYAFRNNNIKPEETTKSSVAWETEESATVEETSIEETTIQETTIEETTIEETTIQEATSEVTTTGIKIITITSGMSSTGVSNLLEEMGIIQDSKEFDTFLRNGGYSRKILVGSYEVSSDASFEEIAKKITGTR